MKLIVTLFILSFYSYGESTCIVTRAGIDIGSGTTKLKVAKVDFCTQNIVSIIHQSNIAVGYKEDLKSSSTNELSLNIFNQGLSALNELKSKAISFGADSVNAVATSAFRTAKNGHQWAKRLELKSGVKIKIITQKEEAIIGFTGAISKSDSSGDTSVVWDIGGGSMQLTGFTTHNDFEIYEGKLAAVSFKNHILSEIKMNSSLSSPNPMTNDQREIALRDAKIIAKITVSDKMKEKIKSSSIIGIGGVHFNSLLKNITDKNFYTIENIDKRLEETKELSDHQIGSPYASTDISNLILVKGFMQALGIKKVMAIEVNLVEGILVNPALVTNANSL